jgi:hypothetical protein
MRGTRADQLRAGESPVAEINRDAAGGIRTPQLGGRALWVVTVEISAANLSDASAELMRSC